MIYRYNIEGMSCNGCRSRVEEALKTVEGINNVEVSLTPPKAILTMDTPVPLEKLQEAISARGHYIILPEEETPQHCCDAPHEHPAKKQADAPKSSKYYCPMHCEGDKTYNKPGDCPVCGMSLVAQTPPEEQDTNYLSLVRKLIVAIIFTVPILILSMGRMIPNNPINEWLSQETSNWLEFIFSLPVVFYAAWIFFRKAWISIKTYNLNMFTLIGIGSGAAFIYSIFGLLCPSVFPEQLKGDTGEVYLYFEAVTVIMTLVLLGQVLEAKAHNKTNSAIKELIKLSPTVATVIVSGEDKEIDISEIKKGDLLRVKPGEKIPVDGYISEGSTSIDESMITGEPIPVNKTKGDKISSGTINGNRSFVMTAEKVGDETLLAHIIAMVEEAGRSRAPIQKLADKIAAIFVPVVISLAVITFIVWAIWGGQHAYIFAISNALAVLIIACPCALGLATPISVMVGVGKGAQSGILIKNAEALERMDKVNILLTDKTGTLTEGHPTVERVQLLNGHTKEEVLMYSGSINKNSEHPLAQAVTSYALSKNIALNPTEDFEALSGQGVTGKVDNNEILLGNDKLMASGGISIDAATQQQVRQEQSHGKTVSYLAVNHEIAAYIVISDAIKDCNRKAIKELSDMGIKVIMLTGDNRQTAQSVANELGLTDFVAECMPEDKLNEIKRLQSEGNIVAMAGDGINDAPALTTADIGIAMGTGTDVAIESAYITLVKGDLNGIIKAKSLSHATMRNIKQNLFFAFIYNILGISIAAGVFYPVLGWLLSPMIAALAMSFSSVSVISNALRLKNIKYNSF